MADKIRRVDFYPDEWIAGTVGLTNELRGLYITACAMIYSHGGSVSRDDLKDACRDHGNALNRQIDRLISLGKLTENGREIMNKRCANELEKAEKRIAKARENGGISNGRPKKNNDLQNQPGISDEKLTTNHQPPTTNQEDSVGSSEPTAASAAPPLVVVAGKDHKPKPDVGKELYVLGKKLLGSGGQVTKVLNFCRQDKLRALAILRDAQGRYDPASWVAKIMRGEEREPYDFDADMAAIGLRPDGTMFGDEAFVPPLQRPGDDGNGNLVSVA